MQAFAATLRLIRPLRRHRRAISVVAAVFLIPFVIVLKISFSETQIAMPPYLPLLQWSSDRLAHPLASQSRATFLLVGRQSVSARIFESVKVAAISTVFALLICLSTWPMPLRAASLQRAPFY